MKLIKATLKQHVSFASNNTISKRAKRLTYAAYANGARCVAGSRTTVAARRTRLPDAAWKDPMVVIPRSRRGWPRSREKGPRYHPAAEATTTARTRTATKETSTVVPRRCYLVR